MNNIGILGGGQLGKMIAIAAHELGFTPYIFTDKEDSIATEVVKHYTIASYEDNSALMHFAENVDVITIESENIPVKPIEILSKNCIIAPSFNVLKITQDRILEKKFLNNIGVKTAKFYEIKDKNDFLNIEFPILCKTIKGGYDGIGQIFIKDYDQLQSLINNFSFPMIAESVINFEKEISIIIVRNEKGMINFPIAENVHKDGILITSKVKANVSEKIEKNAFNIGKKIAEELDLVGIIAIEFFLIEENELIVNEIAPRPHNSGHWSMDATDISQFHALCLAITGNKIKKPNLIHNCEMRNLLGSDIKKWNEYLYKKNHKVYVYGKKDIRSKRKMGHVNIILDNE